MSRLAEPANYWQLSKSSAFAAVTLRPPRGRDTFILIGIPKILSIKTCEHKSVIIRPLRGHSSHNPSGIPSFRDSTISYQDSEKAVERPFFFDSQLALILKKSLRQSCYTVNQKRL